MAEVKAIKERLGDVEPKLKDVELRFEDLMLLVPNPPLPEVPEGESDDDNVELRSFGSPPKFDFPVKDHLELAEGLDILDMQRAVKIAGARIVPAQERRGNAGIRPFPFCAGPPILQGVHAVYSPAACPA